MPTKKQSKKTNLNLKIFFASIFLIFIFSLSISSITIASSFEEQAIACTKACDVFRCATCDKSCNALPSDCSGVPSTPATCGNNVQESGEECDQSQESAAIFGPNQCQGKGTCNQATCKCSGGSGTTGTNPAPTGQASFSADKVSGTTPLTVNFTLTNGTNCINYMCDTGVGVDSSKYVYGKSFSCTYVSAGSFTASISCNGNILKKTITVSGTGTTATPTPTATPTTSTTPTPTTINTKPEKYMTVHKPYARAPEDKEYWSFAVGGDHSDNYSYKFMTYYRGFIPPGTVSLDIITQQSEEWEINAVARHNKVPFAEPVSGGFGEYYTLSELEAADCFVGYNANMDYLHIARDGFTPPLEKNRAGWLYVRSTGGEVAGKEVFNNNFSVRVDTKTYNAWWDKYIKDEAGWNKYIENVETYIDPTIETKTPTCKADFSKTEITAPGESKLSFSSENTTKLIGSCTGPLPIKELELPLSYINYPFPFTTNQTGTETCTFTPYNGETKGENCSATVTVKNSIASTPAPTPTPTPTISKPKPADYITLHDSYTRAPTDVKITDDDGNWTGKYSEYYSFSQNIATSNGLIDKFRAFVPPGTIIVNSVIKENGKQTTVARHKFPPTAEPTDTPTNNPIIGDFSTLTELMDRDCWSIENQMYALNIVEESFSVPGIPVSKAGWLYVKVGGGEYSQLYNTHFAVRVKTKTYNEWWDKYIKDEAGWNKYIENVETYVDPTTEIQTSPIPTPTPTKTPTPQSSKACKRDNPDCEKLTCNNVYCDDGCERKKGTRVCDGS